MNKTTTDRIKQLLTTQKTGVLATLSPTYPYTTLVAFVIIDDWRSLLFMTPRETQKYENLQNNNAISFLIDNRMNTPSDFSQATTLTILGKAAEVDKQDYQESYLQQHPELSDFFHHPKSAMMKVTIEYFLLVKDFQTVVKVQPQDL